MNIKRISKKIISFILTAGMVIPSMPAAHAALSNIYVDPADVWIKTNGRTGELDSNAEKTYEILYCNVCEMDTSFLLYRVPEYTRTGETAMNRNVRYSDGTCIDGVSKGNTDDGTPGVDAYYTGYHYTKSVCQNCGTINASDGPSNYAFGKNVYYLNACDAEFFLDFDNTAYSAVNSDTHIKTTKKGKYCQFCKGTYATASDTTEAHSFDDEIDAQIGNHRFHVSGECEDCGYLKNSYIMAKSVIQSEYSKVDGKAHTIKVTDLSDRGVNTSIRYGESADRCTDTSAPNYTEEGYYPVYYAITYSYGGESMTENGVSYVLLTGDTDTKVQSDTATPHVHDYRYIETVRPTCTELGYDRFQCADCGALQKTNYVPASGHDYQTVEIRKASCQQGGLELHSCNKCGAFYTEETSMTDHKYQITNVAATCTTNGYTEHNAADQQHRYYG